MVRRVLFLVIVFQLTACAGMQQLANQLPIPGVTNDQIAGGLKEALDKGIANQVTRLALEDGFYKNELVKILLPDELKKVDNTLRAIGMSNLADEGLKVLNRAAEDAVSEAIPVFTAAVKNMSFADAKSILLGDKDAATTYLKNTTSKELYQKFHPIIKNSFQKVGADKIWSELITKYNSIPLTKDVNPDLTNYVTNEALKGVFTMIAIEELEIRNKASKRTSDLLRRVFALQDK